MLQRSGLAASARALCDAVLVTRTAEVRMREELGTDLPVPTEAFLNGVLANRGRSPAGSAVGERVSVDAMRAPVGLIGESPRTLSLESWALEAQERRTRSRPALSA